MAMLLDPRGCWGLAERQQGQRWFPDHAEVPPPQSVFLHPPDEPLSAAMPSEARMSAGERSMRRNKITIRNCPTYIAIRDVAIPDRGTARSQKVLFANPSKSRRAPR